MTTASFTSAAQVPGSHSGATDSSSHPVGSALRAVKVFVGAVFSVTVLGEYGEEAGVRRH
ncbi:hypothetical protein [Streptomyces sp. NPDC020965]|uniref:hypothetical protein n=1 Tax=Streptomyces sp. NPDC020965 TaxID=3365105 RepID=UPI0037928532